MTGELLLTGERTVPGVAEENYWFRRHEAAYQHLAPLAGGARVVEVGCGEGYGTSELARTARWVLGIDYDAATTAHARAHYPAARFVRANLAALPVPSRSVDLVASLQVVEHVWNHGQYVRECLRVLRPGGRFAVTTPNRLTFSPGRDTPLNPFHTKEFTAAELTGLLTANGFCVDEVLGLHAGPRLGALDAHYKTFVDAQLGTPVADWPVELHRDVAAITTADFDVHERDVDASLDLIVVAHRDQ